MREDAGVGCNVGEGEDERLGDAPDTIGAIMAREARLNSKLAVVRDGETVVPWR